MSLKDKGTIYPTTTLAQHRVADPGLFDELWSNDDDDDWTFKVQAPEPTITFNLHGDMLVQVEEDGTVTWPDGYKVTEAAKVFAESLTLGAEHCAGIRKGSIERRAEMWDEVIEAASSKKFLTVWELRKMRDHAILLDRLKGVDNGKDNTDG